MDEGRYRRTTARLILRPYETNDLPAFHDLYRRDEVCRYLPWEPMDIDQARAKLEQRLEQTHLDDDRDALVLAAVEEATGRHVGEFMLRLESVADRQAEVGWCLNPDAHGRGLATEGSREMLRLGFDGLGLHRIHAGSDERNEPSLRVMDRLGMRREALFIDAELVKGDWVRVVVAAILEDEWRAL